MTLKKLLDEISKFDIYSLNDEELRRLTNCLEIKSVICRKRMQTQKILKSKHGNS